MRDFCFGQDWAPLGVAEFMTVAVPASKRTFQFISEPANSLRVVLVRHGKPAIESSPRTSHDGFRRYIDDYQEAGLDPLSAPPEELLDLVKGLNAVHTSTHIVAGSRIIRRSVICGSTACRAAYSANQIEGPGLGSDGTNHVACGLSSGN